MIWRNRHSYEGWEKLLLLSLEVGFRHLREPTGRWWVPSFTGVEHHQEVFDAVLKSNNSEAVVDLAWGSLTSDSSGGLALSICANYIIDHCNGATESFSQELRSAFFSFVNVIGFGALEKVGKGRFVELLNRLQIGIESTACLSRRDAWVVTLLEIIGSAEGVRNLALQPWGLLVGLAIGGHLGSATYNPDVATFLVDAEDWDKLVTWIGVVLMAWPPEPGNVAKELEDATKSLFRQRPGVFQDLTQWLEQHGRQAPELFQRIRDELAP